MFRIALTKGRIEESSLKLMRKCGYDLSAFDDKGRKLIFNCGELEIVLAKAADVVTYVEHGACDAGIVGRDTIMEMGGSYYELLDLGFGKCSFAVAGLPGLNISEGYSHKTVATKYTNVTRSYFAEKGVDCEIIKIEGSVELAPLIGLSDAILDIVETGDTLRANGLVIYERVADISARCIVNNAALKLKRGEIDRFITRLGDVL